MKAVIWNYKFSDMKETWSEQILWIIEALNSLNVTVKKHKDFICKGTENLAVYNHLIDNPCNICIYNHTDASNIIGNVVKANTNLFFKQTVPEVKYSTLDTLGYGPYSSITYKKPDFNSVDKQTVDNFFNTKVKKWITTKSTKWGKYFKNNEEVIKENNYILVLGQCGGDEVVTRHDFGVYFVKLESVVRELSRITNEKIVVKLHPYTDGLKATNDNLTQTLKAKLMNAGNNVIVYTGMTNVHSFIEKSKCVILANSGSGFEAMMHNKPIISWGFPEYHWVTYDLRHLCDLKNAIQLDWFNLESQRNFLYWYMEKYAFYDKETCFKRVSELWNDIMANELVSEYNKE